MGFVDLWYSFRFYLTLDMLKLHIINAKVCSWLVVLRINVDLAIFQPYLDMEAGDNQSLKIQVARPGIDLSTRPPLLPTLCVRLHVVPTRIVCGLLFFVVKLLAFLVRNDFRNHRRVNRYKT